MLNKYYYEKWDAIRFWNKVEKGTPGSKLITNYPRRITKHDLIWGTTEVEGEIITVYLNEEMNDFSIEYVEYPINYNRVYIDYKGIRPYRWGTKNVHYVVTADGWTIKEYLEVEPHSGRYKHVRNGYMPGGSNVIAIKSTVTKGDFLYGIVEAEEGTYPDNGYSNGYWYIKKGLANISPIISGEDSNIGNKYSPFSIKYTIEDKDDTSFTVKENLDGINLKTFKADKDTEYNCTVQQNVFYSLPDGQHTIKIEVVDSAGNKAIRMYTFNKVYIPPVISGEDKNLGVKDKSFGVKYKITCDNPEANTFVVEERLNDLIIRKFDAVKNIEYTLAVQDSTFYKLENGQHVITIKVIDKGKIITRQYTFNKEETSIELQLSKIIDTAKQPKSILINPEWSGIEGNTIKVEGCNNAYDLVPTWEDVTNSIKEGKQYTFTNKTKTADKWGVNIRFMCNKTVTDSTILLKGFKAEIEM